MQPLRFVPYHELGDTPNVIVDGGPTASTRLTLSHWPGSPTPTDLLDDLSAQIAFHALQRSALFDGIEVVSNNHFDQDGLVSVFALVRPDEAMPRRDRLVDVARAGDFATFEHRDAMRVACAIATLSDPDRTTLDVSVFEGDYDEMCGGLYRELLPQLPDLVDDVERSRPLWETEDAHLTESLRAVADGVVTVDSNTALDLAVVTVPESWSEMMTTRFTIPRTEAVHSAAVNTSTDCLRVLTLQGARYRLELRYETWVMFRSRPVAPRPDLRLLAATLNDLDSGGWTASAPGDLTPVLRRDGDSTLSPDTMRRTVEDFLATAAPAWDPYLPRSAG